MKMRCSPHYKNTDVVRFCGITSAIRENRCLGPCHKCWEGSSFQCFIVSRLARMPTLQVSEQLAQITHGPWLRPLTNLNEEVCQMARIEYASALPRKQFFLDMFTRDLSLEDCTLDLIDNSLDSLIEKNHINIAQLVFEEGASQGPGKLSLVDLSCTDQQVTITDNCGGIDYQRALDEVFCFGHKTNQRSGALGAYGIGLKRAMFKMGQQVYIKSQTARDGFEMSLDVLAWSRDEENWTIPITRTQRASSSATAGTTIQITKLHKQVKARINDGSLLTKLLRDIGQTYGFFLNKCVRVRLNSEDIAPDPIPIGGSSELEPAQDSFQQDGVTVTIFAGLASPGPQRSSEKAGWNLLCNGRVVVKADKSELTGWDAGLPKFHSKYTRFVGLALFESDDPLRLPWTTTKRWVNEESMVFQQARNRMISLTRPVTKFIDELYPSDPAEKPEFRGMLNSIVPIPLRRFQPSEVRTFGVKRTSVPAAEQRARIVYSVQKEDVERVRNCIRRPSFTDSQVGRYTFNHFLKTECPE